MDLVSTCKDQLQYFRIKELKDVLTQLGLSKQGKKQELHDRILAIVADDQVSKMWAKRHSVRKEDVAKLVDDTFRLVAVAYLVVTAEISLRLLFHALIPGATDLATKPPIVPDSTPVKPKEEVDDSPQVEMNIRCLCGSSLVTDSMIKCVDPKCQMVQHITCVIIPDKPLEGIPPAPSQFYCELCRLNRADPYGREVFEMLIDSVEIFAMGTTRFLEEREEDRFWSTTAHPLHPVKLMITSVPSDGTNPTQGVEKTFQITRLEKDLLSKPEYDVQAWCMLLNDKVPFRMQWPLYADLQVNGVPVRSINRPGSQALGVNGRDDGPTITPYTKEGINKISLTCCDARLFCLGVRVVKRKNLQQILNMIPKESDGERFEDALARVRRCMKGGGDADDADSDSDLEVVADSFTISLRCPMLGSRMRKAGRFKPCAHMGCFDLDAFVEMQQRSRKWQCPICLKNYSLEHLIVDPYFNRITTLMRSCEEDTTDINVKPDGTWRVKGNTVVKELRQWHLPDSSICGPSEEVKPKVEASECAIKQEGSGLKLGIRKNSNGLWEVSKPTNTLLSGERLQDKFMSNGSEVIPMSSSATGSGREGEDMGVNQDANVNYDFISNSRVELDSMHLNPDQCFQVSNQNASGLDRDSDIIDIIDSDEDNGNMALPNNSHAHAGGINFSMAAPHGLPDAYQGDPALDAGGSLDLFNDEDFGMHLWQLPPTSQAGPSFQLFGSDAAASNPLVNFHQSPMNYPNSINGYSFAQETAMNPNTLLPDSTVDNSNINDLNYGLVDNPLAFGVEDPSLQIFLPTRPSEYSEQTGLRYQQDSSTSTQPKDWISLRLGDGGAQNHRESTTGNGLNAGNELHSEQPPMQPLHESASLFTNDTRPDKAIRQRSDSPVSFPRQRPRLFFPIDLDSE
ncbi:hypothetical protein V2J09_020859 [Rumex salicifolius]